MIGKRSIKPHLHRLLRDADLLPAVREADLQINEHWPQHIEPPLQRWLKHGQNYGLV